MTDATLTPEEQAALHEELEAAGRSVKPEPVDLVAGDRAFREQVPVFERSFELFKLALQDTIGKTLKTPCKVAPKPLEVVGPKTIEQALALHTGVAEIVDQSNALQGFCAFNDEFCAAVVEQVFGGVPLGQKVQAEDEGEGEEAPAEDAGEGESSEAMPAVKQPLTELERETFEMFFDKILVLIQEHVLSGANVRLKHRYVPFGLPTEVPAGLDSALLCRFDLEIAGAQYTLELVLFVELMKLGLQGDSKSGSGKRPEWMVKHLARADVEVTGSLGHIGLSLADLLGLRAGDVLRLDRGRHDTVPVLIEGIHKFNAKPVQQHGVFGVEIETELS